eukprot:TRINITY_DN970_c0_g1_i4.p1 TRINITY_DN970_c0_g1~~TRINITY_DN970_c0_g1_i4.p1  ORF type:complete len:606 (-),score=147.03 TRINITY_DN970_c0_g1_i4:90-1907(-)
MPFLRPCPFLAPTSLCALLLALPLALAQTASETPAFPALPQGYIYEADTPGARCEPYSSADDGACSAYVDFPVHLEAGETQQSLAALFAPYLTVVKSLGGSGSSECARVALPLLCGAMWRPCLNNNPLAERAPCFEMCNVTYDACVGSLGPALANQALGLCQFLPVRGQLYIPSGLDSPCRTVAELTAMVGEGTSIICTDTLRPCKNNTECCPACPIPLSNANNEDFLQHWIQACSWIAFVGSVMCVATWTAIPQKRKFPSSIVLWLGVCTLGVSVAFILSLGGDSVHCQDDVTLATRTNAGCFFQSTMFQFFFLAGACWWACFAFNVNRLIVGHKNLSSFNRYYHAVSWGVPGLLTFVSIVSDSIVYSQTSRICFLKDKPGEQVGLFFFWLGLIGLIGSAFMGQVIYEILIIGSRVTEKSGKKTTVPLRTVAFIVGYNTLIIFTFFYNMASLGVNDKIYKDQDRFYACLMESTAAEPNVYWLNRTFIGHDVLAAYQLAQSYGLSSASLIVEYPNNCQHNQPIDFALVVANTTVVTLVGLWVFLLFGVSAENVVLWKRLANGTLNSLTPSTLSRTQTSGTLEPSSPRRASAAETELHMVKPGSVS